MVTSSFTVNSTDTLDELVLNATFAQNQLDLWLKNRSGELGGAPSNQIGWFRLPQNASVFSSQSDPSAGSTSGHYEVIFNASSDKVLLTIFVPTTYHPNF